MIRLFILNLLMMHGSMAYCQSSQDTLDFLAGIERTNHSIMLDSLEYANYYDRGMYFYFLGSFQNAKSDLEHALALVNRKPNPFPTEGYVEKLHMTCLVLGWIEAYHSNQKDKAISYLENAITLDPTRFRPYRVLGEIYLERGDSTLACRYFKLAFRNKGSDEYALPEICKE